MNQCVWIRTNHLWTVWTFLRRSHWSTDLAKVDSTTSQNNRSVAPHRVEQPKFEFAGLNFQVGTGSRYLGSFIGETTERDSWIANKENDWVYSIKKLAGTCPQGAYSAFQRPLQQEWQYLQRTTPNTESCFDLLEKTMQEEFLPELLGEEIDDGEYRLELAHLPMNYSVLALPNTVNSASPNHQASKNVSAISSVH